MTTTHASTAAPKPVETANKPAQANARANADKPAAADLFASLLNLVSDTHLAPDTSAPALDDAPGDPPPAPDGQEQNPLAALLALLMHLVWFRRARHLAATLQRMGNGELQAHHCEVATLCGELVELLERCGCTHHRDALAR